MMHGLKILVVEDDFISNMEMCELLRENGFTVKSAYCADAAFEFLRQGGQLSFLVTDVDLGPGPNGFAVARYARAAYPGLPIIFVSGSLQAGPAARGVNGSQFISKPFRPEQIIDALISASLPEAA